MPGTQRAKAGLTCHICQSLVLYFYPKASSALLWTVHSILDHTPAQLCYEIILGGNNGAFDDLKGELDRYIQKCLPGKPEVMRNSKYEGLTQGRMLRRAHAAEVLVLLDSPCWPPSGGTGHTVVCPVMRHQAPTAPPLWCGGASPGGCTSGGTLFPFLRSEGWREPWHL